jgi:CheY-like chemotaxis protein
MTDHRVRILLGDTNPASHAILGPICEQQGWELLVAESSFQILRMIRDASDIGLVMVNPALPGSGVSGKDVARTLKGSSQFGALPVMFVLHEGQTMPEGCAVNGAIEVDRSEPARLLAAMRDAIGIGGDGEHPAPATGTAPEPEAPRAVTAEPAPVLTAVAPAPDHAPSGRSARIVVADTVARTRSVLEPLFARQGWELIGVESGFQVLRAVRDSEVHLVLINPNLQASGVSGADIARTIKGASQFKKLPVYFVVHEGQTSPKAAMVDGVVELDGWPPARILSTLNAAMGRPEGSVVAIPASPPHPTRVEPEPAHAEPESVEPESVAAPPRAIEPTPEPPSLPAAPAGAPTAAPTDLIRRLREEMFAEVRRAVDTAARHFADSEARSAIERAARQYAASEGRGVIDALLPQIRDEWLQEVRRAAEADGRDVLERAIREFVATEGRELTEQVIGSTAREMLPEMAARLTPEPAPGAPPAVPIDEVVARLREQLEQDIRAALESATRQAHADGRAAVEAAARQYVAGEARGIVEPLIAAMAREVVPAVAERLVQRELERPPNPAARVDELLPQIREHMLEDARRVAEAVSREHAGREARAAMEDAARRYLASEGHSIAEPLVTSLAREIVPALTERLVRQQIDNLPSPAEKVDEILPQVREQMLQEARRATEAIVLRYTETDGRALAEQVLRQFASTLGASLGEDIVRAAARDAVPKIAERLVQQELARLPSPASKVGELLQQMREQIIQEARRAVEGVARRYAESDGRSVVDSVMRQFASTQGVTLAEEMTRAAAREIVPAVAERLVQQELARLPNPAAKVDELLPSVRDQILHEGRRAAEAVARRYAETDGRATIESVIRQHTATHGMTFAEELVRSVARELVPAVAERLIRDEIARLRREHRLD